MKLARRGFLIAATALAAGCAFTHQRTTDRTQEAEAKYPPLGEFVSVDGARVHYVQKGGGPHLVLLHGAGGNLREFTFDMVDTLAETYTVTAFDRPGLGYTDRLPQVDQGAFATEGESPQDQADLLRRASAMIGIENPVVVGHSFGGIVAMAWANAGLDTESAVNAAGVVSLGGVAMPWPGTLGLYYTMNGSALGGGLVVPLISAYAGETQIEGAIESIFAPQPPAPGYAEYIGSELTIRPESFRANARQVNTLRPHVVEMAKRYPELQLPIEIVHGEADTTVPLSIHGRELAKITQGVTITALPGVGHMPHHADRQATLDAIDRAASRAGLR